MTAFDKDTLAKEKKKGKDAAATQTPGQPDEGAGAVAPNLSKEKKNRKDAAATGTPGQPDEGAGAVAPNLSEGKGSK